MSNADIMLGGSIASFAMQSGGNKDEGSSNREDYFGRRN